MTNKEKNNLFEKLIAVHPEITVGEFHQKMIGADNLERFIEDSKVKNKGKIR